MNISDLIIFQTVANKGSINRAAQELNYVQSNVTSRIQKLENELNTKLFHRHQRGITLTNEGEAILPYVQKMIHLAEEIKWIASNRKNPTGKLDIASVETVIKLPLILSKYVENYPEVDLTLSTGVTTELKEQVLKYELDGAFVTKSDVTFDPNLHQIDVFHENLTLITNNVERTLDEVMELPLIRFSDGCGYRAKLDEWLLDQNLTPSKVMELGTLETTLGSVISGLGVAYVPYSAVKEYEEKGLIRCYFLPNQYSQITTVFIYRKNDYMKPALRTFVETIKNIMKNSIESNESK